ncbi:hypothetical protein COOONC_19244 [Cooperia oncophora]
MLKGFIQRRTHHLLKAILPESKEFVLLLRKSPLQHALYRNFVMYANSEISSGNTSVFNPLKAFAACSKIWNHPDILAKTLERKREERRKLAQQKDGTDQASDRGPSCSERQQVNSMTSAPTWPSRSHEGTSYPPSACYSQEMTPGHPISTCAPIPGPSNICMDSTPNNTWNSSYCSNSSQPGVNIFESLCVSSR